MRQPPRRAEPEMPEGWDPGQLPIGYVAQLNSQRGRKKKFLGFYQHKTKKRSKGGNRKPVRPVQD